MTERIAVAMSGGVDSSAAALLLQRGGFDVFGVTLSLWDYHGPAMTPHSCCRPEDIRDARRVAWQVGIPHYVLDYTAPFRSQVVDRFAADYAAGRTPSPCILCNTHIKFGRLLEEVTAMGASRLATGHYARIVGVSGGSRLARAADREKDQSYFLFEIGQRELERALFPLGDLTKTEVRGTLQEAGLAIHEKPESQELCFVAGDDYAAFLAKEYGIEDAPGAIVGPSGERLGRHRGVFLYTVGQRRGLGLSGPEPYYVTRLDAAAREVHVGYQQEVMRRAFLARDVRWTGGEARPGRYCVQIRSRHAAAPATVMVEPEGRCRIEFDEPQLAITPGQAAVFYDGDRIEGGGWIAEVV